MSAPRDVLERAFPPPGDAFARLTTRRDRRDRNRRIADGAVAIVIVVALVAALIGAVTHQQRHEPAGLITPSNVGQLGLAWWGSMSPPASSQPVVDGERVYVVSDDGTLAAFSTECATDTCSPIWSAKQSQGSATPRGSAIVDSGRVYQPSSDGRLVGYPTSCDASPCQPDWIGDAAGDLTSADPVASGGSVFVAGQSCCHGSSSSGELFAFAESCTSYPEPCRPVWRGSIPGGFEGGQPIVVGDRVYVGSKDGTVEAFPTDCAAVARRCDPVWTARTHGPRLGTQPSRIQSPLVANGSNLFVPSGSWVYAFPLSCDASPCSPSWIARRPDGWINDLTATSEFVYASELPHTVYPRPGFPGGTVVYPTDCAHPCKPAWVYEHRLSSPVIANGVAYLFGSGDPGDRAFDAACGAGADACPSLWTMGLDNGSSHVPATVVDGTVYVTGDDGNLHVFRLGGSATCCVPASRGVGQPAGDLVFYGALLGGVAWFVARRRRRFRAL